MRSNLFLILNYINKYLKKGDSRTALAKKNILASFIFKGTSIIVNLLLVTLTIKYIDPSRYGIWLTLSSIIAWFSFFDMGFGHGLRNKFTEAIALNQLEKAKEYVSTTYFIIAIIFFVIWLVFFGLNFFIDWPYFLNAPQAMLEELSLLAIIVFSFFCLQIVLKTINTILIADQKPAVASFLDMLSQLIVLVTIYLLTLYTEGSIIYLGITVGAAPIFISMIFSIYFYNNEYKAYKPSLKHINLSYLKDIFSLGYKFFFIQISVVIIYQSNNIIIAQVGSPNDVTVFNIAFKYLHLALLLFTIIVTPFWSAFTDAYTQKDFSWMRGVFKKLQQVSYFMIGFVIVLCISSQTVYKHWIGNLVDIPNQVTLFCAVYIILLIIITYNHQIINGMGKLRVQMISYIFAIILHIPLAYFLGIRHGIIGVLGSGIIFYTIIAITALIQSKKLLLNNASGVWNK